MAHSNRGQKGPEQGGRLMECQSAPPRALERVHFMASCLIPTSELPVLGKDPDLWPVARFHSTNLMKLPRSRLPVSLVSVLQVLT